MTTDQCHAEHRIVEYFGMPGAGKTYLASQLYFRLVADNILISDRSIKIGQAKSLKRIIIKTCLIIKESLHNRASNRHALELILLYKPSNIRLFIKLIFNWLFICALISNEFRRTNAMILDQGIAQALWSTEFYSSRSPDERKVASLLLELLHSLSISTLKIFYVSANVELIKERIQARTQGQSPLDQDPTLIGLAQTSTQRAKFIVEQLTKITHRISFHEIENNGFANTETMLSV